jgi:hypothetical protein
MLWHVNQFLSFNLGDEVPEKQKIPMPMPIMRFFLLYMPWPKGAPTHKQAVAKSEHDFEAERRACSTGRASTTSPRWERRTRRMRAGTVTNEVRVHPT